MKDRNGLDYDELLQVQNAQLALWGTKLREGLIQPIAEYVRRHNAPADSPEGKHRVYRGGDLIEIIRQWPELQSPYPPIINPLDEV